MLGKRGGSPRPREAEPLFVAPLLLVCSCTRRPHGTKVNLIENFTNLTRLQDRDTKTSVAPLCYAIFIAYALALFFVSQKALYEIDQKLVPEGDAFTYATFFYELLNRAHYSFSAAIQLIADKNYNWLQDFLVLLLSPILFNESSSLIIINYLCFTISTLLIFRTALRCKVPQFWAFCVALLFAAMPWNFHALMEFNLTSLMPDPVFMSAYLCAALLLCWFSSNPYSRPLAIACGLALGAAIWSRWNAFIYVAMPLTGFGVIGALRLIFAKQRLDRATLMNCATLALICSTMATIYFWFMHRAIFGYGTEVVRSLSFDLQRKIAGAVWFALNVPGLAIAAQCFAPNTDRTLPYAVFLTFLAHAIALYSAVVGVKKILSNERSDVLVGALGLIGATIFYLDIALILCTFSGYYSDSTFRDPHSFSPTIVGLVCCTASALCGLLSRRNIPRVNYKMAYVAVAVIAALNSARIVMSSFQYAFDQAVSRSSNISQSQPAAKPANNACDNIPVFGQTYLPKDALKTFALRFREASANKRAYFFWYGLFNDQIVDYYAAQENLASLRLLPQRSNLDMSVWDATYNPQLTTPEPWFRDFLKYVFAHADYVVIPERLAALGEIWPSPMSAYYKDVAAALNSPEIAPDYLVWGVIEESTRVLVLKRRRADKTDSGLELFPRTWGTPAQVIGRDFKGALVAARTQLWQVDVVAEPELLYSYHGYHVIRVANFISPLLYSSAPWTSRPCWRTPRRDRQQQNSSLRATLVAWNV